MGFNVKNVLSEIDNRLFTVVNTEKSVLYHNEGIIVLKGSVKFNKGFVKNYLIKKFVSINKCSIRVINIKKKEIFFRGKKGSSSCYKKFIIKLI